MALAERSTTKLVLLALALAPAAAGAQRLTLIEAVQAGVANNLAISSERLGLGRQEALSRAAWRAYSPAVVMDANLARVRAGTDPFGRSALLAYSAGVQWRSPVGTVLSAEAFMTQGLPDAVEHQGALVLAARQPLLKDGWHAAALPLTEAELLANAQRELFRQALNALIVEIETAYWDLALAEADVVIKTRSRERARQQYEDTKENIRRGILADVEIYVVEENVVFFQGELAQAEENLRRARTRLAELLTLAADATVTPAQPLERPGFGLPDRGEVLATGLAANPRIQAQRLRHELALARERYASNQALPQLDLSGSLSVLGSDPRYGPAFGDPGDPEARLGLSLAVPLDRGAERAAVRAASLEAQREATTLANTEQQVRFEIVNGLTDLETNLGLLQLTEQQLKLAELKLNAETEKYRSGISTLADVVRFQRDLDNAHIRLQRVTRSVHVGRVRLLASQGTLHEVMGVGLR